MSRDDSYTKNKNKNSFKQSYNVKNTNKRIETVTFDVIELIRYNNLLRH